MLHIRLRTKELPMIQIYFLSVIINILAGSILAKESLDEKFPPLSGFTSLFKGAGSKGFIGALAFVLGIIKLLTVHAGDIPVIGDLIPALAGLASGGALMLEYYKEKATTSSDLIEKLDNNVLANKNIFGISGILAGFLHFLLPGLLFL